MEYIDRGWKFLYFKDISFVDEEYGSEGYIYYDGSGYYNGNDGSKGYIYSDGSGYYNDSDGSEGHIYSDGSGYYRGANGSEGEINSDGSGNYTDVYGQKHYYDSNDNTESYGVDPYKDSEVDDALTGIIVGGILVGAGLWLGAKFVKRAANSRHERNGVITKTESRQSYKCPYCDAELTVQDGFEASREWICTECWTHLYNDNGDYTKAKYFCPECNAILETQSGFCEGSDFECSKCDTRLYYDSSEEKYNVARYICPECDAILDDQAGFNEYDDDWECRCCGTKLHHEYPDEEYTVISECDQSADTVSRSKEETIYYVQSDELQEKSNSKASFFLTVFLLLFLIVGAIGYEVYLLTPIGYSTEDLIGKKFKTVEMQLTDAGFSRIQGKEISDLPLNRVEEDGIVTGVSLGPIENFSKTTKYPSNLRISVTYHSLEKYAVPFSAKAVKGLNHKDVEAAFRKAGFTDIIEVVEYDIVTGWLSEDGEVKSVTINGEKKFKEGSFYRADAQVVITYHTLRKNKPNV